MIDIKKIRLQVFLREITEDIKDVLSILIKPELFRSVSHHEGSPGASRTRV